MALSQAEYRQLSDPKFNNSLIAYGMSLCKDRGNAEDLAQQTVLKILENQRQYQSGTNLRAWAFTILRNIFITDRRRAKREVITGGDMTDEDDESSPMLAFHGADGNQMAHLELKEVLTAFDYLNPDHRQILELTAIDQLNYEDTAQELGVQLGTVKSRVNRAKARLAEILENPGSFGVNLSPRHNFQPSLAEKTQIIVHGHYTPPAPQRALRRTEPIIRDTREREATVNNAMIVKDDSKHMPPKRRGKYYTNLLNVLERLGIEGNPLESKKFIELMGRLGEKNEKNKSTVIKVIEGKTFNDIAREEGALPATVSARFAQALTLMERKPKKKPHGKKQYNLSKILQSDELRTLKALNEGKSVPDIAENSRITPAQTIVILQNINERLKGIIEAHESTPEASTSSSSRKKNSYHKATLKRVFAAAGIKEKPLKSEAAQKLMEEALTERQRQITIEVLKGRPISDIADRLNIGRQSVYVTFNKAIENLEAACSQPDRAIEPPKVATVKAPAPKKPKEQEQYSPLHHQLRNVLIRQGVTGNPLKCDRFNELASSRLTPLQRETVKQIIIGRKPDEIARNDNVDKTTVIARLETAIRKLSLRV